MQNDNGDACVESTRRNVDEKECDDHETFLLPGEGAAVVMLVAVLLLVRNPEPECAKATRRRERNENLYVKRTTSWRRR